MKKMIIFFTTLVLIISLVACASSELSVADQMYIKYKPIIDMMEAGDYESASQLIKDYSVSEILVDADIPESHLAETETVRPTETIEITMENYDTYFETVIESKFEKNPFGEYEFINYYKTFKLKEEYENRLSNQSSKVTFDFLCNYRLSHISYDKITAEYTIEFVGYDFSDNMILDYTVDNGYIWNIFLDDRGMARTDLGECHHELFIVDSFSIERVIGSLEFYC